MVRMDDDQRYVCRKIAKRHIGPYKAIYGNKVGSWPIGFRTQPYGIIIAYHTLLALSGPVVLIVPDRE